MVFGGVSLTLLSFFGATRFNRKRERGEMEWCVRMCEGGGDHVRLMRVLA